MHCDTLKQDNDSTVRGDGGSRVGEVRAGTTSPMPEHKGFMPTVTVRDPPSHTSSLRVNGHLFDAIFDCLLFLSFSADGSCFYIDEHLNTDKELVGPDCDPVYRVVTDKQRYMYTACRDGGIRKYRRA